MVKYSSLRIPWAEPVYMTKWDSLFDKAQVFVLPSVNQRLFFSFRDELLDKFPEVHLEETTQEDLQVSRAGA